MNTCLKATEKCPDPARARHFLKLLEATSAGPALKKFDAEQARVLAALLSGSQAMSGMLVGNPELLHLLDLEGLQFARRKDGLIRELSLQKALEQRDYANAFKLLRQFKQREMFRVGARDLARLGTAPEITQEISDVADVCLQSVLEICSIQLTERQGRPWHQDPSGNWHPTSGCVLGLGKLGGQELNYSSDVDVVFVYSDEGAVFKEEPPGNGRAGRKKGPGRSRGRSGREESMRPQMTNHQFFNRLAEYFIAEVTRLAPEGVLYRIDLRLRPEGESGPLSRALAGYENYYAQWGQTWERMMLIKARKVAGDEVLAGEFLEMIQSFRYPRSINPSVLREVAGMKDRIENEVLKADELDRNVKLGRGGIREIEFVAQALQLLHAGRQPFLQGARTLPTLQKLVEYELLSREDQGALFEAYVFLRDVEHRLQMEDNRQTHTIPVERQSRERLARLMGFTGLKPFEAALQGHTKNVRRIFHRVLQAEVPESRAQTSFPRQFEGLEAQWTTLLGEHGFRDPEKAFRMLREFVEGPGFVHVSQRTKDLALELVPKLLASCPVPTGARESVESGKKESGQLSDPDRVVTRLDSFISAYGARATLFELWNSNPGIFELLVRLFDRSEFLAELAIRNPDLVDELVTSGRLRQRKSSEETLEDLRHGINDADQHAWLRRYHQAELMRIGLRDILGLADFEQYLVELSALADACLQYSWEVVMKKNRIKRAPFVIIGLGKLGGAEIDYGSDLDLIFVADSKAKKLSELAGLAREITDLISTRTAEGLSFHTDTRLRPDGEKGLLVNTLAAFDEYYRKRAMLWEIQSLTRTRSVAGDMKVGEAFKALASTLTNFKQIKVPLAAHTPDWKRKIHQMRLRIQKERTPAGQDDLAIKTGTGGLMDAEFVAQAVSMENGWYEPNTLRSLELARAARAFAGVEKLIENYRRLRRVEGILRRWSYEGETVLPTDPAPYRRVAIRCGFSDPQAFRKTLAAWRHAIREVYLRVFQ